MLLKQTAIQTVENISLLNDRARPENSFFFRQGIRPTRSPFHIIMAQIMLTFNFQLIFFKCKANHLLKMISFISFEELRAWTPQVWTYAYFSILAKIAWIFVCDLWFSRQTLPCIFFRHFSRPIIFFDHRYDCFQMWDNV